MKQANCTEYTPRLLPALRLLLLVAACAWLPAAGQPAPAQDQAAATPVAAGTQPKKQEAETETEAETWSISQEQRDMQLLASTQPAATVVWQDAMELPFLSLYEQDFTGNPVGAVLILNAEGQHSSWPETSRRIRLSLPEFGWNTLSTQLPAPRPEPVPPRQAETATQTAPSPPATDPSRPDPTTPDSTTPDSTTPDSTTPNPTTPDPTTPDPPPADPASKTAGQADDGESQPAPQAADDKQPDGAGNTPPEAGNDSKKPAPEQSPGEQQIDVEALSLARLRRSIEYLHERGQFNIILIGNGVGAARAACYVSELPASSKASQSRLIRAMIFVNARNRIPGSDRQLQDCLPDPAVPVLDIYAGSQQRDSIEAQQRLRSSRRKGFALYQQLHFPDLGQTTSQGENFLSRRIRGFLERHARGVKVDNAIINR